MEVGVTLAHSLTADPIALRDLGQAAEALGYQSLWTNEHIAIPEGYRSRFPYSADGHAHFRNDTEYGESMAVLSHLAALTRRVRLGVSVIPLTTRHPVFLAKQAATVDALSGGRLELGIGAGWLLEEADVLGLPRDHRTARLAETIDILRLAWSLPSFAYRGRYWQIPEVWVMPKPPQGRVLPIWVGGGGPAVLEVVAQRAEGVAVLGSPDRVRAVRASANALNPRTLVGAAMVLGSGDEVARAEAFRDAGAGLLTVNPHPQSGTSPASIVAAMAAIERFARDVMPAL